MEFAVAAGLIAGRVGLGELTDAFVQRPDVQKLMQRVVLETNQNYEPGADVPGAAVYDQVCVHLTDGTVLESERVKTAKGHATRPLTETELLEKFRGCLEVGGTRHDAAQLFGRISALQGLGSARELAGQG
jgi:2-methylcitrate dehydratase PrpD